MKDYLFTDDTDDQPLLKTQSAYCIPTHCSQSKSEGYFSGNDEPEQPPITVGSRPDLAAMITAEEASNPAVSLPVPNSRNCHTLPPKLPLVNIERPRHFSSPPMLRFPDKSQQTPDECDSPNILSPVAVFFSGEEFVSSTESILEALANEVSTKVASLRRKATNLVSGTVFQQQATNSSAYGSSSLSDSCEDQESVVTKPTTDKQSTSEHNVYLPAIEMAEEGTGMIHRRNENARYKHLHIINKKRDRLPELLVQQLTTAYFYGAPGNNKMALLMRLQVGHPTGSNYNTILCILVCLMDL